MDINADTLTLLRAKAEAEGVTTIHSHTLLGLLDIIEKLPETADHVRVVPGMKVWLSCEMAGYHGQPEGKAVEAIVIWVSTDAMKIQFHSGEEWTILACQVYSTQAAAEAAKEQGQ